MSNDNRINIGDGLFVFPMNWPMAFVCVALLASMTTCKGFASANNSETERARIAAAAKEAK